jgi:probable F420-dependent oxidoreductase
LPDPLEWLAFAAAHSTNLLLGTAVLILPLHHPVVLAKRLATLDQLAGGRLRLGIGVGWNRQEFAACGAEWEGRGERAEEIVEALRVLWSEERATFRGPTIGFEPVYSSPKPVNGAVPVLVGATLPVGARRAGRIGDGFLPFERDLDRLEQLVATMRQAATDAGRDPAAVEITALGGVRPERIERLARLGVARMLLFEADVDALPALGRRMNEMVAEHS